MAVAPKSLSVIDATDTAVTLSWMIPDMPNGNITKYQLECSPEVTYSQTHHSFTGEMSGLYPGTKYRFRVAAITEEGECGPFSNIVYHNTASKFSGIHMFNLAIVYISINIYARVPHNLMVSHCNKMGGVRCLNTFVD